MTAASQNLYLAALTLAIATAFVVVMMRRGHDPGTWWFVAWLVTSVPGTLLRVPALHTSFDRVVGQSDASVLAAVLSFLANVACFLIWSTHWQHSPQRRRRPALLVAAPLVVGAALVVLFEVGSHPVESNSPFTFLAAPPDAATKAFLLIYTSALVLGWLAVAVRCRAARRSQLGANARQASDSCEQPTGWAADGIRLWEAAAWLSALGAASLMIRPLTDRRLRFTTVSTINATTAAIAVMAALGATCAVWGPLIDRALSNRRRTAQTRRAEHRLSELLHLWQVLYLGTESSPVRDAATDGLELGVAIDLVAMRNKDGLRDLEQRLSGAAHALQIRPPDLAHPCSRAVPRAWARAITTSAWSLAKPCGKPQVPSFGSLDLDADFQIRIVRALPRARSGARVRRAATRCAARPDNNSDR